MDTTGRILIADDEGVFLSATADLLRKAGYHCDSVQDGHAAAAQLRAEDYDVLIADIKMPGNPDLELVQQVKEMSSGLQVILVTGYPSMQTAVKSIGLPVVAYLIKPVDFDELLGHVKNAVERARIRAIVQKSQESLRELEGLVEQVRRVLAEKPEDSGLVALETFIGITLQNIVSSLVNLSNVTEALGNLTGEPDVCHLMNCPRVGRLIGAVKEAVEVLEKSKSAFKSKDLGELRRRLETVLESGG